MSQIRELSESFAKAATQVSIPLAKNIYGDLDRAFIEATLPNGVSLDYYQDTEEQVFVRLRGSATRDLREGCAMFLRSLLKAIAEKAS